MNTDTEQRRFPIGRFTPPGTLSPEERIQRISRIESLPERLSKAVLELNQISIDKSYREGGWTARQVVHHIADSHVNAWVRFKLALTEEQPTIRPYNEAAWANLPDHDEPVDKTLELIRVLHSRWAVLLRSLSEDDWKRKLYHPESGVMTLDDLLANYAWHGDHHVAHVILAGK